VLADQSAPLLSCLWVVKRKIMRKVRGAELHVHNEVSTAARACVYHSKNLDAWKLSKYCSRDVVAVMVKNLTVHERVLFSLDYMPHDEKPPQRE